MPSPPRPRPPPPKETETVESVGSMIAAASRGTPANRLRSMLPAAGEPGVVEARRRLSAPPARPDQDERGHEAGHILAGKYQLTRIIGHGGMGVVWAARDTKLAVDVAVKLIPRDRSSPLLAERLLMEARAAARLAHASIVRVFEFGESDEGDPYIAMELLTGQSLGAVLEREDRLPAADAIQLLLPIARALDYAHGRGVVHRDFKPDNIFIVAGEGGDVVPKLVDFGVAKLKTPDVAHHKLTMDGTIVGSPAYMSPEQARGLREIDHRTDIWAFGVVLFETICGRLPFIGNNYNSLLVAILTEEPTPGPALSRDPALLRIITKLLTKDLATRYAAMREVTADLVQWLLAHDIAEDIAGAPLTARTSLLSLTDGGEVSVRRPQSDLAAPQQETLLAAEPATEVVSDALELPQLPPRRRPVGLLVAALCAVVAAIVIWVRMSTPPPAAAQAPATSASEASPATLPTPVETASSAPTAPPITPVDRDEKKTPKKDPKKPPPVAPPPTSTVRLIPADPNY